MMALLRGRSLRADAAGRVKDDRLPGVDGQVWSTVLGLWAYSALSGALAVGVGQMMVSVTRGVVPTLPVRLGSLLAVVVAAGLAAEHVLDHLRRLVGRDDLDADRR